MFSPKHSPGFIQSKNVGDRKGFNNETVLFDFLCYFVLYQKIYTIYRV